jgi:xylulokinase
LLKWFRDQLGGLERREAAKRGVDPYDVICAEMPSEPSGLLVLPHFTMTGTPWLDPHALGAILGLRLTTTRQEIARALMEGVAFEILLNARLLASAGVAIDRYKAIGGAARSAAWLELYADVLERPVVRLDVTEGAALGVALLGAYGAGLLKSPGEIDGVIRASAREGKVFEPNPPRAQKYRQRFELYQDLYPATRDLTHRLFAQTEPAS